ncbi:MAG: hypothetical protein U5Q03_18680 [Bacteroidota bacterium]|nr:hypothetical protein [Bacteroidota bacterium]
MEIYFGGPRKVFADVNGFTIKTDQHPRGGGEGEFPEPFTLFLASLGTCAGIFVKGFCDQRGIDTSNIKLRQEQSLQSCKKDHRPDRDQHSCTGRFSGKIRKGHGAYRQSLYGKRHLKEEISVDVKVVRD